MSFQTNIESLPYLKQHNGVLSFFGEVTFHWYVSFNSWVGLKGKTSILIQDHDAVTDPL